LQGESIADFAAKVQPKDPIETHDHLSGSNFIIAGMHGCPLVADGVEITVGWSFKPPVKHFSDAVKALKIVLNDANYEPTRRHTINFLNKVGRLLSLGLQ
jgi:hypothetical protein